MTIEERFLAKVLKQPDGCWRWTGAFTPNGYGSMGMPGVSQMNTHRVSWQLYRGELPKGRALFVCHTCDNRWCVNPGHLFLGTAKDNAVDAVSKGRYPTGEHHHAAKLTVETAAQVRAAVGVSQRRLAKLFGVSQRTIWSVRAGDSYRNGGV